MNKTLKRALNKVQDFVAAPQVNTATKVAKGVLEVASQIGQAKIGGPVAVVGAVMGTLNVIQNTLGIERFDICDDYCAKHPELKLVNSSLSKTLEQSGAMRFLPLKTVVENPITKKKLVGLTNAGKSLMFLCYGDDATGNLRYDNIYFIEEGFDKSVIRTACWQALDAPIVKLAYGPNETPILEPSQYDDIPYLGKHSPAEFAEAIDVYRARGISRASLLEGPPGTGKTSFVRAYARHTGQSLMIIPPDFLSSHTRTAAERLIKLMMPEILLIDDIDRAPSGFAFAMEMVDDIRRTFPMMVMVTTVNQIVKTNAALLRPGRLGERRRFLAPPDPEKKILLDFYMKRYAVNPQDFDMDELVSAMVHKNFSHDYVRFVAEQAVVLGQQKLLVSIKEMVELLDISEALEPSISGTLAPPPSIQKASEESPED